MASTVIKRISDTAEKLYALRREIEDREEENKRQLEGLKIERDALQVALLADLSKNELSSIKTKSGDSFTRAVRKGVDVVDERKALEWAIAHRAVSINKVLTASLLRDAKEYPEGFKYSETEYISVRKAKQNHDAI